VEKQNYSKQDCLIRILWIAPNLNHYKKRFLARLVETSDLEIVVLAGRGNIAQGHRDDGGPVPYEVVYVPAEKARFAFHPGVFSRVSRLIARAKFDVVLVPAEKKHLPLILWLGALRWIFGFHLVTYSHPVLRSRRDKINGHDLAWTRRVFRLFDKVVFYTEKARDWAVREGFVEVGKAAFANNTLDTETIWKHHDFEINRTRPPVLLFIGRLVPSKRLDLLLEYYRALKAEIPDLRLTIIGDGPEANRVRKAAASNADIRWCGALVDEEDIAGEMKKAHLVFIPGESGLSIVHAFAYGKPYVTCDLPECAHGPELAYLRDGENGLLVSGNFAENVARIRLLLEGGEAYERACLAASETAKSLSIENWCAQMAAALGGEGCGDARQDTSM
jgi:glycosyltransferase involved in cell wall biosynthesis